MPKYEVVVGIYDTVAEKFVEEETVLETDDLAEAQEEYTDLVGEDEEDDEEFEVVDQRGEPGEEE